MTQPVLTDALALLREQVDTLPSVLKDIGDLFGLAGDGGFVAIPAQGRLTDEPLYGH